MGFKTSSLIFLFIFVTLSQRIFISGRLRGEYEGPRECDNEQIFLKKDTSFERHLRQAYAGKLQHYQMNCGGNRSSHTTRGPGAYLAKQINGRLENNEEPQRCTFRIQAPEDYRVYVFMFQYQFLPDNYKCIDDNNKAILADWVKFYDGKLEENSLLYSALHNPGDFNATSTGRDLLIDIDLSGRNVLSIDTLFQRFDFGYAFIKNENGQVVVYNETKP